MGVDSFSRKAEDSVSRELEVVSLEVGAESFPCEQPIRQKDKRMAMLSNQAIRVDDLVE